MAIQELNRYAAKSLPKSPPRLPSLRFLSALSFKGNADRPTKPIEPRLIFSARGDQTPTASAGSALEPVTEEWWLAVAWQES